VRVAVMEKRGKSRDQIPAHRLLLLRRLPLKLSSHLPDGYII
jgi:hypothetical protein